MLLGVPSYHLPRRERAGQDPRGLGVQGTQGEGVQLLWKTNRQGIRILQSIPHSWTNHGWASFLLDLDSPVSKMGGCGRQTHGGLQCPDLMGK